MRPDFLGRAVQCKALREAGLFTEHPGLSDSLLIYAHGCFYILMTGNTKYLLFRISSGSVRLMSSVNYNRRLSFEEIADNFSGILDSAG
jgi:hypothetical protein